jgi:Tfp pilus assembly protein PilF
VSPAQPTARSWTSSRRTLCALLLVALTAAAYSNSLTGIFHGLDARESIRDNPHIRQLWPLSEAMSLDLWKETLAKDPGAKGGSVVRRPVLSLSFAVNRLLLGADARGFQLVNVGIHMLAGLCLLALGYRTLSLERFSALPRDDVFGLALAVAALWMLHPVQTESVTYVVQRAESLMGLFYLATLYAFVRAATASETARQGWLIAAVMSCALGMGTKEAMATAPVVALLFDRVFLADSLRQAWRERGDLHAALMATWLILIVLLAVTFPDARRDFEEGRTLGYVLGQPRALLAYAWLVLWPHPLHLYVNSQLYLANPWEMTSMGVIVPLIMVAALIVIGLGGAYRRRIWGFLLTAFFLLLAPSSVIATSDTFQEHRVYLASTCIVGLVVCAAYGAARRVGSLPFARALQAAGVGVLLLFAVLTHGRNRDYRSELAIVYPPDIPEASAIVARHELSLGRASEAFDLVHRGAEEIVDPQIKAKLYTQLGFLYVLEERLAEAQEQFQTAVRIDPRYELGHNNLGAVAALGGNLQEAGEHLQRAMEVGAGLPMTINNLAVVAMKNGDLEAAKQTLERGSERYPAWEILRNNQRQIGARSAEEIQRAGLSFTFAEKAGEVGLLLVIQE